ncbi:MAG: hypothetical protein A2017_21140 [Lentisphaerae bacterium GWF2_44_16]|nr:MAG: hypothetical protein A2017_21140 [Lentisphaerae bacterium GWF2_44_16]
MIAAACVLFVLAIILWAILWHNSSILYPVFFKGKRLGKKIALTFDDGPSPECTPQLLDMLAKYNVKATFFCIGALAEKYPEILKRIHQEGHLLANHCYEHAAGTFFKHPSEIQDMIIRTGNIIRNTAGYFPRFYRSPAGVKTPPQVFAVWRLGLSFVGWSVWALDGGRKILSLAKALRIAEKTRGGDIILLHDGSIGMNGLENDGKSHSDALLKNLPHILEKFNEKGLSCVRLDELLKMPCGIENAPLTLEKAPSSSPGSLIKALLLALITEKASPAVLSLSVGLGVFIGCTPLFGLHTFLALVIGMKLRLHKLGMILGTNITNPLTGPVIIWVSIQCGWRILYGEWHKMNMAEIHAQPFHELFNKFILSWLAGFPVVGLISALIIMGIVYPILKLFTSHSR